MQKRFVIYIYVLVFSLVFSPIFATRTSAQVQSTDVILSTTPTYPSPGDTVTATISSYVTDLDKANMAWSVNGETLLSGVGKKRFTFTLGSAGSTTSLNVDIQTIDRQSFSKSLTLNAVTVDMLWEATDSYVPPFYKGKALVSREGSFKVVVIPNIVSGGSIVNPKNLSYTWEKDGNGQVASSGWGKNFFLFKNSYLAPQNEISVKVSDIFGSVESGNTLSLETSTPKVALYSKHPIFGLDISKVITDGHLVEKDGETLVAIPYFFSPKNINSPDLKFDWKINRNAAQSATAKNELRIKGEEGKSGTAKIELTVNNTKTLFQNIIKELNVVF